MTLYGPVAAAPDADRWTQQGVADRLAQLTGHTLPQASISAMERGFDGERRRRFDAHELYLLSVLFEVPIAYFFVPPPGSERTQLADTGRPLVELYPAMLGQEWQLGPLDERLTEIGLKNPEEADQALVAIFGPRGAAGGWHEHFRTWRKRRLRQVERQYGDRLDEVTDFLADFANQPGLMRRHSRSGVTSCPRNAGRTAITTPARPVFARTIADDLA